MNIETREVSGVTVLDLHGKITIGEDTQKLRATIGEVLGSGKKNILVNLGDITSMDSAGIGELVSSYTSVTNQGGQLKLLNLTQRLKELLAITKLLTVFDTYDDEASAIESFS